MVDRLNYRIEVTGPDEGRFAEILTPAALDFLAKLDNTFAGRRRTRRAWKTAASRSPARPTAR